MTVPWLRRSDAGLSQRRLKLSQVSPRRICGGKCGSWTGLSPSTSGSLLQYHSIKAPYSPSSYSSLCQDKRLMSGKSQTKQCCYGGYLTTCPTVTAVRPHMTAVSLSNEMQPLTTFLFSVTPSKYRNDMNRPRPLTSAMFRAC